MRLAATIVAALLVATAPLMLEADPADAAVVGELMVVHGSVPEVFGRCVHAGSADVVTSTCAGLQSGKWEFTVVTYVGTSPRYSVRNTSSGGCLVAFAASGDVGTYTCNSNYADQVWAFEYVRDDPDGYPLFRLRNRHSGQCLVANYQRSPTVFMYGCGNYDDQLFWHFS